MGFERVKMYVNIVADVVVVAVTLLLLLLLLLLQK